MSVATVAVGLTSKAFVNLGLCPIQVTRLNILLDALQSPERDNARGVLTVSNHISTLDDPLTWGVLPSRCHFSSRMSRWSLGASDIIFTNPLFSAFFRLGQTLETFRGQGIYQDAVDTAIRKLDEGAWVHLFPEGKINQPNAYSVDAQGSAHLPRLKWGVGRMLMESARLPVIIPMWLTGYENLMPLGRPFPYNYLPRLGTPMSVTFGDPISPERLTSALSAIGSTGEPLTTDAQRSNVTRVIQEELEKLGRSVSGKLLRSPDHN